MPGKSRALLGALLCLAAFPSAAAAPQVQIDRIRAQLLYARSGTLSEDIAPPSKFSGWNTIIGEGDAREPANDVLVSVVLTSKAAEANVDAPLVVTVSAGKKVLAKRTIANLFLSSHRTVRAVFVPDAACAGEITVTAVLGKLKKTTGVSLPCGE